MRSPDFEMLPLMRQATGAVGHRGGPQRRKLGELKPIPPNLKPKANRQEKPAKHDSASAPFQPRRGFESVFTYTHLSPKRAHGNLNPKPRSQRYQHAANHIQGKTHNILATLVLPAFVATGS